MGFILRKIMHSLSFDQTLVRVGVRDRMNYVKGGLSLHPSPVFPFFFTERLVELAIQLP
jgi:hypothetical protein